MKKFGSILIIVWSLIAFIVGITNLFVSKTGGAVAVIGGIIYLFLLGAVVVNGIIGMFKTKKYLGWITVSVASVILVLLVLTSAGIANDSFFAMWGKGTGTGLMAGFAGAALVLTAICYSIGLTLISITTLKK
ncbi:hypothetical protein SSABA_v1c02770 [Spiroplasma sabaudiense Ar-1343]|uniref:Transmembrane protein n=1 Tax=Spiroplasma sabaudiense Ar-1343 TaxID=1276257 RepID=W6AJ19_9MOLU|nr:hypothetical protein [Spiroplasma sabaudiense]AHI53689.1 hypothetical protein SSABA_v1c02770 [Spiroplasma sabaudiense Ar-1343]